MAETDIGRVLELCFNLPSEYLGSLIVTNSNFLPMDRTCATFISADISLRTTLAANFRREDKNIEFLWKQNPGTGRVADTKEVFMLLKDEGDGEAARGP